MINKEDYVEPVCPFCTPENQEFIPVSRVIEKLDEYLFKKQFSDAERLLVYWKDEAKRIGDIRGRLFVLNETVGFYRKQNDEKNALTAIEESLSVAECEDLKGTVLLGTTYLNIATGYKSFSYDEKSLLFYGKAEEIYRKTLSENDEKKAGLYNNKALCLMDLKLFDDAEKYFLRAIDVLNKNDGTQTELAITYCNMLDLVYAKTGIKNNPDITEYAKKSFGYFTACKKADGDYAYACEKCAPTFRYYGFSEYAEKLEEISRRIYERA